MKYGFLTVLFVVVLCLPASARAQTVIDCPRGFVGSTRGPCSTGWAGNQIWLPGGIPQTGPQIQLLKGSVHQAFNALTQTPVNIQAFTTTFTWQVDCSPDPTNCGNGFGFMIVGANSSNPVYPPGFTYNGSASDQFSWSYGCKVFGPPSDDNAGCEGVDLALLKFDLYGNTSPGQNLTNYYQSSTTIGGTNPHSASDLNMAPSGINIQSGHVFSTTLTYNGSTLVETVTDTNTGAVFTHTYTTDTRGNAINLPSIMGGNTAFVGFGASNGAATMDVFLNSWTYTAGRGGA